MMSLSIPETAVTPCTGAQTKRAEDVWVAFLLKLHIIFT